MYPHLQTHLYPHLYPLKKNVAIFVPTPSFSLLCTHKRTHEKMYPQMWSRNNMRPYMCPLNKRTHKCADNKKCTHKCGHIFLDKMPRIVYTNYRNK